MKTGRPFTVVIPDEVRARLSRLCRYTMPAATCAPHFKPSSDPQVYGSECDFRAHLVRHILDEVSLAMEEAISGLPVGDACRFVCRPRIEIADPGLGHTSRSWLRARSEEEAVKQLLQEAVL